MITIAVIFILLASPFVFERGSALSVGIKSNTVWAFDFKASLINVGAKVGLTTSSGITVSLPVFIGRIIYYLLGFIGVVFLVLAILAGLKWMLAGGDEDTVAKAKSSLLNAALGALVALSAYAITYFIIDAVVK